MREITKQTIISLNDLIQNEIIVKVFMKIQEKYGLTEEEIAEKILVGAFEKAIAEGGVTEEEKQILKDIDAAVHIGILGKFFRDPLTPQEAGSFQERIEAEGVE